MEMISEFGVGEGGGRGGRMRRTATTGRLRMRRDVFCIFFKGE
jgi:hypothetical protein